MSDSTWPDWPQMPGALVVARFARIHGDGTDDDDRPDWIAPAGVEVRFTPSITGDVVYDPTGAKIIVSLAPFVGIILEDGHVVAKDGGHPIRLAPTDDPLMTRTGWHWSATWATGRVDFPAPSEGAVNLADFIIAPPGNPVVEEWVARIPELIDVVSSAGTTAVDAAAEAVAARDTATGAASTATGAATTATAAASTATAARDATLAASTIVGAGRPDVPASMTADVQSLVSAATSGAVFRSTDGPQGAWEWRKRGTTWVCIEGDTGWRNVDGLIANGWTATYLNILLRNGVVYVNVSGLSGAASTSIDMFTLPVGWRPGGARYAGVGAIADALAPGASLYWGTLGGASAEVVRAPQSLTSGRGQFSFPVGAWPTTLPGNPV